MTKRISVKIEGFFLALLLGAGCICPERESLGPGLQEFNTPGNAQILVDSVRSYEVGFHAPATTFESDGEIRALPSLDLVLGGATLTLMKLPKKGDSVTEKIKGDDLVTNKHELFVTEAATGAATQIMEFKHAGGKFEGWSTEGELAFNVRECDGQGACTRRAYRRDAGAWVHEEAPTDWQWIEQGAYTRLRIDGNGGDQGEFTLTYSTAGAPAPAKRIVARPRRDAAGTVAAVDFFELVDAQPERPLGSYAPPAGEYGAVAFRSVLAGDKILLTFARGAGDGGDAFAVLDVAAGTAHAADADDRAGFSGARTMRATSFDGAYFAAVERTKVRWEGRVVLRLDSSGKMHRRFSYDVDLDSKLGSVRQEGVFEARGYEMFDGSCSL